MLMGGAILLLAQVSHAAGEIQPPFFSIGDSWEMHKVDGLHPNMELQHVKYKITRTGSDFIAFEGVDNDRTYTGMFTPGLNLFTRADAQGRIAARRVLQWPLFTGKKYEYEYFNGREMMTAHVSVGNTEDVTTPAGKFKAIRIDIVGEWRSYNAANSSGKWTESRWYSQEVKNIIRDEYKFFNEKNVVFSWSVEELLSKNIKTQ
jgi:hypothetical protein